MCACVYLNGRVCACVCGRAKVLEHRVPGGCVCVRVSVSASEFVCVYLDGKVCVRVSECVCVLV